MIVLDTHIWVWWVQGDQRLAPDFQACIKSHEATGIGVSIISCWEVAKLVEKGKLSFQQPVEDWINQALSYPGVQLLALTPRIVVESTQLPGNFHRDPADQLVVATARVYNCPLVTADGNIRGYQYVQLVP